MLPASLTDAHGPLIRSNSILTLGGIHPNVSRLTFADGTCLIAKRSLFYPQTRGKPYDLLDTEVTVTTLLSDAGLAVASVRAVDREEGMVYLEEIAGSTLDDAIQTSSPLDRARLSDRVIEVVGALGAALHAHEGALADRIAPGGDAESVRARFLSLIDHLPSPPHTTRLTELIETLADRPMTIGPTDYNARNIIISLDETPHFIDLAKVGYDWPERRLIQYVTSLGAGRPGSTVTTLLDSVSIQHYGAQSTRARRSLDAHHFLFHTLALVGGLHVAQPALITPLSDWKIVKEARMTISKASQTGQNFHHDMDK